jgi:hypothetical protein
MSTSRRFNPLRGVLPACLVEAVATAVPAGASAATEFHMTRDFSANGDVATAFGKHCGASKYGDWRWRASVGSGDLRVNYRWIERIQPDGKARHLRFTEISGPIVDSQPESLQDDFVAAVARILNKVTVRTLDGGAELGYTTPTGGKSTLRFKPARGLLTRLRTASAP